MEFYCFSREMLEAEAAEAASLTQNPANFGATFMRHCICEVPGQIPCPGWQHLPRGMRGKWKRKFALGEATEEDLLVDDSKPIPKESEVD